MSGEGMANRNLSRITWDSSCFIAFISGEQGRSEICGAVLNAAERGEVELYTSYMSLVETVKVPTAESDEAAELEIQSFFENQFIRKVQLEWFISMEARRLQRMTNLSGRDAVHLATALQIGADVFFAHLR